MPIITIIPVRDKPCSHSSPSVTFLFWAPQQVYVCDDANSLLLVGRWYYACVLISIGCTEEPMMSVSDLMPTNVDKSDAPTQYFGKVYLASIARLSRR